MKIKKVKKFKYKLLKLKLIKTKIYKKNYYDNTKIEEILVKLKKAFYIIYKYHISNKTILFLGTNMKLNKELNKLMKKTKHFFLPEFNWTNGILTNPKYYFKSVSPKKKLANILLKKKKKINLIVLLDKLKNQAALKEIHLTSIPVISLNMDSIKLNDKASYKVPGNFKFVNSKFKNHFFYSLFNAILKKKISYKTKNFYIASKLYRLSIIQQAITKRKRYARENAPKRNRYAKNTFFKSKKSI